MTLVLWLLACAGNAEDSAPPSVGPTLQHTPEVTRVLEGEAIEVRATATDPDGVSLVTLYHRQPDSSYWTTTPMGQEGDAWLATIPGSDVLEPGVEYYLQAIDGGSPGAVSALPAEGAAAPFSVDVAVRGASLPFYEDFEQVTSPYDPLFQLGWGVSSQGFAGYAWELSPAGGYSGVQAAAHGRGFDGVSAMDDWLVTPALDLSGADRVQVTWYESGSGPMLAHTLWISTDERDPAEGTYEQVAQLSTPTGAWERSPVIDLTAWAGAEVAWLAWRYEGAYHDDWYIDDVEVRALTCALEAAVAWTPDPVDPGQTMRITTSLDNVVDAACPPLTATLIVPPDAGVLVDDTVDIPSVAPLGSAEASFDLALASDWPDNSYLDAELHLVGDGLDLTLPVRVTVGVPSTGRVRLELLDGGGVDLSFGVGDVDAPDWERQLFAGTAKAGVLDLDFDVTEDAAWLPPAAGDRRWFARVATEGNASVKVFRVTTDGREYNATVLPTVRAGDEVVVWLPEPPNPLLQSWTTGGTLAPGDAGVPLDVTVRNAGADTAGPVTATLLSTDPGVTLVAAGPVAATTGVWPGNGTISLVGQFRFDVAPTHLDSTDLDFELVLDDGAESWSLPIAVPVPWPVLTVTAVEVDDRTDGNGDGLLDPGETAGLEVDLTNTGDLAATGTVVSALAVAAGSAVDATVLVETDSLGFMNPGTTRSVTFQLEVDAGAAPGDLLKLQVTSTDTVATYTTPIDVALSEPIWLLLSPSGDATGDANGHTFDLANVAWRSDGSHVELRVTSAAPFDPDTAFVEAFILASGEYPFYRVVLLGGTARVQGYDTSAGFIDLVLPPISYPSDREMEVGWDVADMGVGVANLLAGFGAGWCAEATGDFCDHFPDGWGYYYTGYSSANFFSLPL